MKKWYESLERNQKIALFALLITGVFVLILALLVMNGQNSNQDNNQDNENLIPEVEYAPNPYYEAFKRALNDNNRVFGTRSVLPLNYEATFSFYNQEDNTDNNLLVRKYNNVILVEDGERRYFILNENKPTRETAVFSGYSHLRPRVLSSLWGTPQVLVYHDFLEHLIQRTPITREENNRIVRSADMSVYENARARFLNPALAVEHNLERQFQIIITYSNNEIRTLEIRFEDDDYGGGTVMTTITRVNFRNIGEVEKFGINSDMF